jgi:micrococcal nuclease
MVMRLFTIALLILCLTAPAGAKNKTRVFDATVIWASNSDADSFNIIAGGRVDTVRMLGIDAPELDQPHGALAGLQLKCRIAGQKVRLAVVGRGYYGRLLARVEHNGQDLAAWLVSNGWAWATQKKLRPVMEQAKAAGVGIWVNPNSIKPKKWRKLSCLKKVEAWRIFLRK